MTRQEAIGESRSGTGCCGSGLGGAGTVRCIVPAGRAVVAKERAGIARDMLRECRFCAHDCGVNRIEGERGRCHAGAEVRVFSAQTEVSDELELIPTFAIALSGCDLRCSFCITGAESWNPRSGQVFEPVALADRACQALAGGARTVMILGGEPTVNLHAALEIVAALPDTARLVWKTNAHGTALARKLLDGMFDVWVADYKFGNDECAHRLAGVAGYGNIVRENLLWAAGHSELIVRHLVMPGHVNCCWEPVAEWLAARLPGVKVNLRTGFWPAWRARQHVELTQALSKEEQELVWSIAADCALKLIE